jgi:hypothetical protein
VDGPYHKFIYICINYFISKTGPENRPVNRMENPARRDYSHHRFPDIDRDFMAKA